MRASASPGSFEQARGLAAADDYERLARDRAIDQLADAQQGVVAEIVQAGGDLAGWQSARAGDISRVRAMMEGILASGLSLPKLMVLAGTRVICRNGAAPAMPHERE